MIFKPKVIKVKLLLYSTSVARQILVALTLLFALQGFCAAQTVAQDKKVTLHVVNEPLANVLADLSKQTNYKFFYSDNVTDPNQKVTLNVSNQSLKDVLEQIFKGKDIGFQLKNEQILLFKGKSNPDTNSGKRTRQIAGHVVDDKGEALIGVTIIIKGSSKGTVTDVNGQYKLEVPEQATLQFSSVGLGTETLSVGNQSTINVTLKELATGLNEVVVVGYGTQKKVNMTGAVSQIKFGDMAESRPITTVSNALAGVSSGVQVTQGSGQPGSEGATIRIRGTGTLNNSNPLVIVDGMEGSMDNLNPQDIESISILKDAAASAIYGSRAANGVVLVTTKSGSNKKLSVSYTGMLSTSTPTHIVNFVSDYPTYMRLLNESITNIGNSGGFAQSTIDAWVAANTSPNALNSIGVPNYVAYPNTDWNKEMYKNSIIQEHSVSVNGSTTNARFLLSAGYINNPGLVENTGMTRYNFRTNAEVDITKWLTVGTRTYGNLDNNENGNFSGMLNYFYQATPGLYPRWNGVLGYPEATEESPTANNLYTSINANLGFKRTSRVNTTMYAKINLLKGLTYNFNLNYNKSLNESNSHTNPATGYRMKFSTETVTSPASTSDNCSTNFYMATSYQYTLENLLKYQFNLAQKHHFSALLGYNESYYNYYYTSATKKGMFDKNAYDFDAATSMVDISGNSTDYATRSVFGRVNYDFDNRYLFEANLRYDGSSRFSPDDNRRWGVFPSFSAGWRVTEEKFMKNQKVFDNLKLRLSWGKLGNSVTPSSNYDYMALYNSAAYSFGSAAVTGLVATKFPNQLLKWESTTMTNVGLEAAFLKNRLTTEFDIYSRQTDGILSTPPSIITTGTATAPSLNLAGVSNKGVEITIGWQDRIGEVHYSIKGNMSFNVNEVTKYRGKLEEGWDATGSTYSSNLGQVSTGDYYRTIEGHQINEYYVYKIYHGTGAYFNSDGSVNKNGGPKDGMIRTTQDMAWLKAMMAAGSKFGPYFGTSPTKGTLYYGDYIYADLNGDGSYGNSSDREFTKKSYMPTIVFGFQMNAEWKGFDVSLNWSGQAGNQIYWNQIGYNSSLTRTGFAIGQMVANNHYYYNESNDSDPANSINSLYPRLKNNQSDTQNSLASDRWLYSGAYLRLKNVALGYTLPTKIVNKIFAEKIRIFASAENLFTISSFPGQDPEMITAANGNTNYPLLRQFAFGANITF